jgi:tetratricopeptide (TPR) repeat protein
MKDLNREQMEFFDLEKEGLKFFKKQDYKTALTWFMTAFSRQPDCAAALYKVGRTLDEMGNYPMAEDFYVAAVTQGSVDAMYQLGVLYDTLGRGREAVEPLRAFLKASQATDDEFTKDAKTMLDKHDTHRLKLVWSHP